MKETAGYGLRVFLQYWVLIALLCGFNIYNYMKKGSLLSLTVAILCGVVFIGWVSFYLFYVRGKE